MQTAKLDLDVATIRAVESAPKDGRPVCRWRHWRFQNLPNPQAFVASFRGSHRYVLDYLAEEVMRQLGAEICRFLMATSVLKAVQWRRMWRMTGRTDSQALLQSLEQANLFIVRWTMNASGIAIITSLQIIFAPCSAGPRSDGVVPEGCGVGVRPMR